MLVEIGGDRPHSAVAASVQSILVDTSTDLRAQALAPRHPPRRRDPLHAQPRRPRDGARRGPAASTRCRKVRSPASATRRRWPTSRGCSRTSSARRGHGRRDSTAVAVPHRRTVFARRRRDRAGAAAARPPPDSRLPVRRVRVPDRLQRDSRRVVAAARRRAHARARRAARSAASDALHRRRSARRRRAARARAHLLHAHLPRSAARRDVRAAARRRGTGL